jgi:hypothetical protein
MNYLGLFHQLVPASKANNLLDNGLQFNQCQLCLVVPAEDELGVLGKHGELLVTTLTPRHPRRAHASLYRHVAESLARYLHFERCSIIIRKQSKNGTAISGTCIAYTQIKILLSETNLHPYIRSLSTAYAFNSKKKKIHFIVKTKIEERDPTRSSRLVRLSSVACLASHQRQQLRVDAGRNSLGMGEQLSLAASPPPLLCCHEILCTVPSTEDTRHRQETAMPPCSPPPVGATSGHVEASAARATTWCRREGGSWSLQMSEKL